MNKPGTTHPAAGGAAPAEVKRDIYALAALLPEGVSWHDPITPDIAAHIAALASPQVTPAQPPEPAIWLTQKEFDVLSKAKKTERETVPLYLAAPAPVAPTKVFLVATGEVVDGLETYTRHEGAPPPLCDSELLYAAPVAPTPVNPYTGGVARENWRRGFEGERFIGPNGSAARGFYDEGVKARRTAEVAPTPAQPSEDARDAARYRKLREEAERRFVEFGNGMHASAFRLDRAVDALPSEPEGESGHD